jgi:hypothetical protein
LSSVASLDDRRAVVRGELPDGYRWRHFAEVLPNGDVHFPAPGAPWSRLQSVVVGPKGEVFGLAEAPLLTRGPAGEWVGNREVARVCWTKILARAWEHARAARELADAAPVEPTPEGAFRSVVEHFPGPVSDARVRELWEDR